MTPTWTHYPCPLGCGQTHPLPTKRRGPARPYSGPYIDPLRPGSREARDSVPGGSPELHEARDGASPDSPESSRSKAAGAVMPGSRSPRPVARALRVGG